MLSEQERRNKGTCSTAACATVHKDSLVGSKYRKVIALLTWLLTLLDHLACHICHSFVGKVRSFASGRFMVLPDVVSHLSEVMHIL